LKRNGIIIISVPFLNHVHADPFDFQRWTDTKWRFELKEIGFAVEKLIIMGRFFSHFAQNFKDLFNAVERNYRGGSLLIRIFAPILNKIQGLDNKEFVRKDIILKNFHGGYFIIARK